MGYKYKVNHEYFDDIDSEYKAYMLGLIYADGCVKQPKGNRQKCLVISLQEEDGYILDKFSKDACGGSKYLLNPPSVEFKGWKKRSVVNLTSNHLCDRLIKLGCIIKKSQLGMTFPMLDKSMEPHFIRGFLDGDGSIIIGKVSYNYKRKKDFRIRNPHKQGFKLRIAFSSTDKTFLLKIAEVLGIDRPYIPVKIRKQENYILWIENKNDTERCIEYLYSNANYYFKRKHDKLLEFNKIIKSQAESKLSEGLETT